MRVFLVAHTTPVYETMSAASGYQWVPERQAQEWNDEGIALEPWQNIAGDLSEFAGRMCYQSWSKPNPETATNAGYINNLKKQKHWSVLEHGSVSLAIDEVSRSLTHELVRHRHFSYSQLSQRYVVPGTQQAVIPPLFRGVSEAERLIEEHWKASCELYETLCDMALEQIYTEDVKAAHGANKRAREAARSVLPNAAPTQIVVTGNHVAWRHFLDMRGSEHADAEIRELAIKVYRELVELEPNIYDDYELAEVVIRYNELNRPAETTTVVRRKDIV